METKWPRASKTLGAIDYSISAQIWAPRTVRMEVLTIALASVLLKGHIHRERVGSALAESRELNNLSTELIVEGKRMAVSAVRVPLWSEYLYRHIPGLYGYRIVIGIDDIEGVAKGRVESLVDC